MKWGDPSSKTHGTSNLFGVFSIAKVGPGATTILLEESWLSNHLVYMEKTAFLHTIETL